MSDEPNYIYTGTVIHKGEPETFGNFTKAALVVSDGDDKYPQQVEFDVSGKALDHFDKYQVGDTVAVKFNLKGRPGTGKWEGRWFTNLQAWRVDKVSAAAEAEPEAKTEPDPAAGAEEGLPF